MIEPVIKELIVPVDPARAFEVFTKEIGAWWPLDSHSVSASTGGQAKTVEMQPKVGGEILETLATGDKVAWGEITEWEPGRKLAFTWHLRRPKGEQTIVSVAFSKVEGGTAVRLIHTGWDSQRDEGQANREEYNGGWAAVFITGYGGMFAT